MRAHTYTHTHTHTHTHFLWNVGHPIGVMVFILYKLYVLLPYTYPSPKLSPHRRRLHFYFPPKNSLCMIYKCLKGGDMGQCSYKSLYLVIPMSYLCHYTNVYPHLSQKHTHTIQCEFCIQVSYALSWWLLAVCKIFSPQACHVELGQW